MKPIKVEISYRTIVFSFFFLLFMVALWSIRDILALLLICFVLTESLEPTVDKLQAYKIPRPLAIILIYLVVVALLSILVASVVPIVVEQTSSLAETLPAALSQFSFLGLDASSITSQLRIIENLPGNIARASVALVSNTFSLFVVFVLTFYLLLERESLPKYSLSVFGPKGKVKALKLVSQLEKRLGNWVNAELLLMTIVGLTSYVGYSLIGLNYALPLALVAGLLEIVPNIGPTISTVLAAIVGLTLSPLHSLMAVLWGIIVQILENNVIVPRVMKTTVGLNPLVTIVVLAIGAKIGGFVGAILGIPVYITLETLFRIFASPKIASRSR